MVLNSLITDYLKSAGESTLKSISDSVEKDASLLPELVAKCSTLSEVIPTLTALHIVAINAACSHKNLESVTGLIRTNYSEVANLKPSDIFKAFVLMGDICVILGCSSDIDGELLRNAAVHFTCALCIPLKSKHIPSYILEVFLRYHHLSHILNLPFLPQHANSVLKESDNLLLQIKKLDIKAESKALSFKMSAEVIAALDFLSSQKSLVDLVAKAARPFVKVSVSEFLLHLEEKLNFKIERADLENLIVIGVSLGCLPVNTSFETLGAANECLHFNATLSEEQKGKLMSKIVHMRQKFEALNHPIMALPKKLK